ncbi:MAG: sulfur carrier protein ThiS [Gemmatimonadetes bacterium]|uniref:Sulfur carrier protein ThiS n=1 Tax=Candidatus Kutchimonas denitrificans TaxID=3056748 RepID=A0AAE4ZA73_9BACT|nr:sulfur carrier protein ThiS [Gemmatimonadota bacterium]NIR75522.1 sulfur carrier protein ThiS [Candidatus Kutchimonas denitrificans]NIS01836.1 sulfur carrier protein ThiS [Gemmatimonadota bacterium]NIT67617.1 sulfur carrier protein ThiS [Gemmatimonadota bacterium]NIU53491.1 sulfur carrier protein ThiS [Gemmatimonadota bacterium]
MSEDTVSIVLNGEEREVPAGLNVRELLSHLGLQEGAVVVELNREIVRREGYDAVEIEPGDTIELVHFVGGG